MPFRIFAIDGGGSQKFFWIYLVEKELREKMANLLLSNVFLSYLQENWRRPQS